VAVVEVDVAEAVEMRRPTLAWDSYRLTGAKSVREVRVWAKENADGRQFVIWIELPPDDERTIARVEGVDPTNPHERHLAE
jgi:hypothetical protein